MKNIPYKKFYLTINKDDEIEVGIIFIYNGDQSDIKVQARRKKEVSKKESIGTIYETIEIY